MPSRNSINANLHYAQAFLRQRTPIRRHGIPFPRLAIPSLDSAVPVLPIANTALSLATADRRRS